MLLFNVNVIVVVTCVVQLILCSANTQAQTTTTKENESFLTDGGNLHYLHYEEINELFTRLEKDYPNLVRKYSIGKSVKDRDLIALKLSENAVEDKRPLLRPMVKMSANLRGDEAVGREIVIFLAQYLTSNYANSKEIQNLLNTTEIHLVPSCNPDGFELAKEGNCESLPNYVGRTNAAGVDLNRDFPDRLENQQVSQLRSHSRQPETAALVQWIVSNPFVLSANFHGGAVVASYPYDNSIAHHECCEESLTPDDRVFKLMAHTYADNNPIMRNGHNCNDTFTDGVTNGANWYELNGGMQDFNYAFSNCFELTIELSCCKYPPASTLPAEWARNKRSLMQLLKLAHIGVKGIVKDASGYPINEATIIVSGLEDKPVRTTQRGEYWRLLTPGIYNIQAAAFGYQPSLPQQVHITNDNSEALRLDFTLSPVETNYDGDFRKLVVERSEPSSPKEYPGGFLTPTKFEHHNFTALEKFIRNIVESYPSITRLYSIGKSVQNRDLWVMEIFAKPGKHVRGVPEFKYVANMHGNEVVGREMLLLLTKYMCERYLIDERVTKIINTTRMHFLYSMNPDGYEMSTEGDKSSAIGRGNANNVDLNRNFPDQYGTDKYNRVTEPEVAALMNWTLSLPFVLSANLHGGALVANYPYDDNENDFLSSIARLRVAGPMKSKLNPTEDNKLFQHLALVYANAHPTMHLGNPCPLFKHDVFPQGITNGAQWYSVTGGMQDWNYIHAGVLELTLELGCDKFPMAAELPKYWEDNREPLLRFLEQVHYGAHGSVKSSISTPIPGAMITIDGAKHATYSAVDGDYWKLALPGNHTITVLADGYAPHRETFIIPEAERSVQHDVVMMRDDPQHWASANDYRIIDNVVRTKYHSSAEYRRKLAELESRNGQIATFGYGESEFGQYFNNLKLTYDIGEPEETKYKILIIGSFFNATGPLGREITLNLMRHVIGGYRQREPPMLKMLEKSIIYFLPMNDNNDEILNMYHMNDSICDPFGGNDLAERILEPEMDRQKDLLLQFLEIRRFDLMLTFTAGTSELNYPKEEPIIERLAHAIEETEFSAQTLKCRNTATHTAQHDATTRLTNLFYKLYNIPMFSLGLSCCQMPKQSEIASIWRQNLDKMKNFLKLIDTGVVGHVQNHKGEPLRNAVIRLVDHSAKYQVTKNTARFQIVLPDGFYKLEISAAGYESQVKGANVKHGEIYDMGNIQLSEFTLITGHSEVHALGGFGKLEPAKAAASTGANSTMTIISGFVLDLQNHPISNAKVSVVDNKNRHLNLRNFTDSMGAYSLNNVPSGDVVLRVEAPRHETKTNELHVGTTGAPVAGVIFRLKFDDHVMGMPRLLFVILSSIILIIGVVFCIMCVQFVIARRKRADKRYYSFTLLPQKGKELFEDDVGEDGETELFRSPIKRGMTMQPYFDEDEMEARIIQSDDDNSDINDNSSEEIIMLEKR